MWRSKDNIVIAGVFGGLGEYFNIDPVILRLLYVFLAVFTAFVPAVIVYFIAVLIIPKKQN